MPSNVTAAVGFPARFDCQSNNIALIRWARGSDLQMITSSNCGGCHQIYSNGSLIFASINLSHGGLYACIIVGVTPFPRVNVYLTVAG